MLLFIVLLCALTSAANDSLIGKFTSAEYLVENAKREDVFVLPSGLQYSIIKSAPPESEKPKASSPCVCHYVGKLVDGTVFDSSRKRGKPATFAPNQVVKGWTEALQLMSPGDMWELVLPASLGYGASGAGGGKIPGGATLIFELELLEVKEASAGFFGNLGLGFLDGLGPGGLPVWGYVLMALYVVYRLSNGSSSGGKTVSASHILIKGEEGERRCVAMMEELATVQSEKGAAAVAKLFGELAKAESTCPSGKSGGSLGTFGPGQMVPAFDKVCWSAPVGEVQGPVTTQFGSHLILVTERNSSDEGKDK